MTTMYGGVSDNNHYDYDDEVFSDTKISDLQRSHSETLAKLITKQRTLLSTIQEDKSTIVGLNNEIHNLQSIIHNLESKLEKHGVKIMRNDNCYNDADSDEGIEVTNKKGIFMSLKDRATSAVKEEAPVAMWLVAARKAIDTTSPKVVKALVAAKVLKPAHVPLATTWLSSQLGSGLYGYAVGSLLSLHPRAASNKWVSNMASYMRIEGMSRIATVLVDPVFNVLEKAMITILDESGIDSLEE